MLSIDAIRAANDLPSEVVEVPEWGGSVLVKGLTKGQATALFETCTIDGEPGDDGKPGPKVIDPKKLQDELLLACVAEPKLTREDLAILEDKANGPVQRIQMACVRVAGLAPEALKQAKSAVAQSA